MITRRIGVDFGTSSSVVCYRDYDGIKDHDIQEISFNDRRFVPTLIWEDDAGGKPLFGWDAEGKRRQKGRRGVQSSFKMGLLSDDPRRRSEAETLVELFFGYLRKGYLRKAYEGGCEQVGGRANYREVTVVTCPGKFDESARAALRHAAKQAGFKNVEVINEAEAALRYVLNRPTGEVLDVFEAARGPLVVMLLDMGAGTSDIALYRCDGVDGDLQVLANYPTGDASTFGGDELDGYLYGFYERLFGNDICMLLSKNDPELGRLLVLDEVRKFKEDPLSISLKNGDVVDIVPAVYARDYIKMDNQEAAHLDRTTFESLLSAYLPQLSDLIEGALDKAGVKAGDVGLVILTGGHSRWYFVRDCLKAAGITAPVVNDSNPRLVVAKGATLVERRKAEPISSPKPPSSSPKQKPERALRSVPDVPVRAGIADYSWAELKMLSRAISSANSDTKGLEIAKEYYLADANGKLRGDTKPLVLTNGTKSSIRILGFRHDKLASGGKAGISFEFADVPMKHRMNPEKRAILFKHPTNEGGWRASEMRGYLRDVFFTKLPDDLRPFVETVIKRTNNVGKINHESDTSVTSSTEDKLWLLSVSEVYGKLSAQTKNVPWSPATYDAEGAQYQLYTNLGVSTTSYGKAEKSGAHSWWWLRSPDAGDSWCFRHVGSDGDWNRWLYARFEGGVSPGFCF